MTTKWAASCCVNWFFFFLTTFIDLKMCTTKLFTVIGSKEVEVIVAFRQRILHGWITKKHSDIWTLNGDSLYCDFGRKKISDKRKSELTFCRWSRFQNVGWLLTYISIGNKTHISSLWLSKATNYNGSKMCQKINFQWHVLKRNPQHGSHGFVSLLKVINSIGIECTYSNIKPKLNANIFMEKCSFCSSNLDLMLMQRSRVRWDSLHNSFLSKIDLARFSIVSRDEYFFKQFQFLTEWKN